MATLKYLIVNPELYLTSLQRAESISRALYLLQSPVHTQFEYEKDVKLLTVLEHEDGRGALEFDENLILRIHPEVSVEKLTHLFPEVSEQERFNLTAVLLSSNQIPLSAIIPSTSTVRDKQYMIDDGWFLSDEEIFNKSLVDKGEDLLDSKAKGRSK